MTQSQASPYMSNSYPYGVSSNGLHGISIHEREREAEKERRAQQLQNVELNSHPAHLFSQPIKIPPSKGDILQSSIKAALGDFDALAPSLNQKRQHSLLGIIPKVPQTPVDAGNKVFSFNNSCHTNDRKEQGNDKTVTKSQKSLSNIHHRTKSNLLEEKTKGVLSDSKPASKSSLSNKEMEVKASQGIKALFLDEAKSKPPNIKKDIKPIGNDVNKSEHQKHLGSREDAKKTKSVKKECKELTSKPKPPKLSIHARSRDWTWRVQNLTSDECKTEGAHLSGDTNSVEKILEEMTQPVAPPITAIDTPIKNKKKFAFPQHVSMLQQDSHTSIGHLDSENHEEESTVLEDLQLSDDEGNDGSSSDDSDSDSSDSDSESSDSDNSPPTSPVRTKSSELNKPAHCSDTDKPPSEEHLFTTTASAFTTSSLSLGDIIGGDGLRGNQVAPAANSSPLNHSSLNTDISPATNVLAKELDGSLFDELPDLSKDLLDDTVFDINGTTSNCLDEILSDGFDNPQTLKHEKSDKDLINHLLTDFNKDVPKVKENNLDDKELTKSSVLSKKLDKKIKIGGDKEMKSSKEKPEKEKHEKPVKSNVKSKKCSDAVKLKSKDNPGTKSLSNSIKMDPKVMKSNKQVGEKKISKPKKGSSKLNLNGSTLTPTKSSDGENEEIDVVTVSNDKPFTNRTESSLKHNKSSENSINLSKSSNNSSIKSKNSSVSKNGRKEPCNGKLSPNLSPKNGLSIDEITLDCNSKPDELVVKIPLALLKRIPFLKGADSLSTKLEYSGTLNDEHQNGVSPSGKATKHQLPVECNESKKMKIEPDLNGTEKSNGIERNEGQHPRIGSPSSIDREQNRRKRSPNRDSDRLHNKRRRPEAEGQRLERDKRRESSKERDSESNIVNGWDRTKDKSPVEKSEVCSCRGRSKNDEHKDSWISKFYEPEARVSRGPDYYLHEAKRVKHHADAIKENLPRAHKYFEAVLNFVQCGKALEQKNDSESRSAYQMYVETIEMLKYAMRLSANRSHQEKNGDKRFFGLCLRLQALLYMRLFKLKKDSMFKASKSLLDHFKGQVKMSQAPSPYNVSNPKMTGTPSPMSPTPSPSGSIGSVGSVGSTSSNEAMTTPSNKMSSNCMTSPVNATIPQKIQTMTFQHLGFTNHMIYSFDAWEQSQQIFNDHKEFFMDLDRNYGPITLHSPIVDVVEYVHQGFQRLKIT